MTYVEDICGAIKYEQIRRQYVLVLGNTVDTHQYGYIYVEFDMKTCAHL